ncbi:RHS repeat protein [Pseudomonas sp. CFBP 8758]|uniref:RHS repeat domain-containing protein n=1 Tax=Pseudomonas sp. CFBP 8758 TaxID=2775286 RepID=UPI0017856CF5|nr:RHS repeat protein [Pseudomonas sp. CFBP 8758]MBD8594142.1 RHS repeat protein [Pseudomonas sp. CFBP 8758]
MSPLRSISDQLAIHARTPALVVSDPRGLAVRTVGYYRREADVPAEPRVSAQWHDHAGRPVSQWDPRQFEHFQSGVSETPNQATVFSLSGTPLQQNNVDSGWKVMINDADGLSRESWDSRGTCVRSIYDQLMRLSAVSEIDAQGHERIAARQTYSPVDSEQAALNRCGLAYRQDDDAGSLFADAFSIIGQPLVTTRKFLAETLLPNWPESVTARDALMEPGPGAISCLSHDALGSVLRTTDAAAHTQHLTYDLSGAQRSCSLRNPAGMQTTLLAEIEFDAAGRAVSQIAGNGVITRRNYSIEDQQLLRLRTWREDGTTLQDLTYTYDPLGNILAIADAAQPVKHFANQRTDPINRYAYDSFYQLIKATGRETLDNDAFAPGLPDLLPISSDPSAMINYCQSFRYDTAGNLQELRHVNGVRNRTLRMSVATRNNRSLPERNGELPTEAALRNGFDPNGNLLELQSGQPLTWNVRNELQAVTTVQRDDAVNDDERYIYDASGRRVRKILSQQRRATTALQEVRYLPGLEIRTQSNGERLHVITAQAGCNNVRVLHWVAGKPQQIANDQVRYSLDNHLGSCTLELDGTAQLLSREEYYPFGGTACRAARSAVEAQYKVIRYSGKERDATGLHYYGLRYYAPWLLRWINPDPGGDIDGLNLYRMVSNNPIGLRDIDGLVGAGWTTVLDAMQSKSSRIARRSKEASVEYESKRNMGYRRSAAVGVLKDVLDIVDRKVNTLEQQVNAEEGSGALVAAGGKRVAAVVISNFGSWLGGTAGTALGAGFGGAVTGGAGAIPGGIAGGIMGGKLGGVLGDKAAEKLGLGGSVNLHSSDLNAAKIHRSAGAGGDRIPGKLIDKIKSYNPADAHGREHLAIEGTKKVLGLVHPAAAYLPDTVKVLHEIYKAEQGKAPDKLGTIIENGRGLIASLDVDLQQIDAMRTSDSDVLIPAAFSKLARISSDTTMSGLQARVRDTQARIASVIDRVTLLRESKTGFSQQVAA